MHLCGLLLLAVLILRNSRPLLLRALVRIASLTLLKVFAFLQLLLRALVRIASLSHFSRIRPELPSAPCTCADCFPSLPPTPRICPLLLRALVRIASRSTQGCHGNPQTSAPCTCADCFLFRTGDMYFLGPSAPCTCADCFLQPHTRLSTSQNFCSVHLCGLLRNSLRSTSH